MTTYPKDLVDLRLAPVVLAIDRRLDELELLDLAELRLRVALDVDVPDGTRDLRKAALLQTVGQDLAAGGWTTSWNGRGIRVVHHHHHVTLGVPATFHDYVEGAVRAG